jgi:5-amino-6-(5-phosphoribosylamino)uracil reductase
MTVDGKIADYQRNPARFGSVRDKLHLCQQVAFMDGILIGAGTLRAYGTSLPIRDRAIIQQREQRQQPAQPVHLVCSRSGNLDPNLPFFRQPIPRWLFTTEQGATAWKPNSLGGFAKILTASDDSVAAWQGLMGQLQAIGWRQVGVLGGGQLIAELLAADLIDELWLTLCPVIFGGETAPTPVGGLGWLGDRALNLTLLSVEQVEQEVFLHYRVARQERLG